MKNILVLLSFLFVFGCDSKQYFTVVVANKSNVKIKKLLVWDNGEKAYSMGVFSPKAQYVREFMYTPLSENIKLTWMEYESGIEREVQVNMIGVIPERYHDGAIQFNIMGPNEVVAKFYFPKRTNYLANPKE